ncbi:MAG TPA: class I SAM-dependent methyltransferase [Thermodesulfobacteriota bacterium]|nr:class I SAM-dependent methyltransferase [Thermodesulfobacteriota bacterium]
MYLVENERPNSLLIVLTFLALALAYVSISSQRADSQVISDEKEKVKLDVPYEPSSEEVVRAMLEIAKVDKNDLVYDLGCGDGRIVIAAAQKTGARGVGVDLDPARIRESLENARKANVADRVQFYQEDLFGTKIGKATVVMLYLWPEVNLKLRPKLFRELKPGTRVVSHSHDMGSWEPDQSITTSDGHKVHFWVVPANVTGTWVWEMPGQKERYILKLRQQFQKVAGTLQLGSNEIPVKNLELRGDGFQFTAEQLFKGQKQTLSFMGRVQDHLIKGTAQVMTAGFQEERTWIAQRNPSSMNLRIYE